MNFRLRLIREKHDLTQRALARELNISKSYYNYFETGERIIPIKRLNDFCNFFNVSFDYVLGLDNNSIVSKKNFKTDAKLIGSRIREIRIKNHLKQIELAKLLNTSQSTISSYEKGRTIILTAFLYEMCNKLHVSADYILGKRNVMKTIITDLK